MNWSMLQLVELLLQLTLIKLALELGLERLTLLQADLLLDVSYFKVLRLLPKIAHGLGQIGDLDERQFFSIAWLCVRIWCRLSLQLGKHLFDFLHLLGIQVVCGLSVRNERLTLSQLWRGCLWSSSHAGWLACLSFILLILPLLLVSPEVFPYFMLPWLMMLIQLAQMEAFAERVEALVEICLSVAQLGLLQFAAFVDGRLAFAEVLAQSVKELAWNGLLSHVALLCASL